MGTYFTPGDPEYFSRQLSQLGSAAYANIGDKPGEVPDSGAPTYDPIAACKSNLSATTNPGAGNDLLQGYSVGSVWINVTLSTVYICVDNTKAAAVWVKLSP